MLLDELANRIRSRREKLGLKQQDIAHALNVSPQAVSKWERGENAPDIAVLKPLARLLGVSTDWLLAVGDEDRDTFEATVLVSSIEGAHRMSLGMAPRDFATWANGVFHSLTETTLQHGGVPVKYIGDGYLCFFSGPDHQRRGIETALRAKTVIGKDLIVGLSAGPIYLGSVGHADYARPDIMGETVNVAFLTMQWAQSSAESGLAATESVLVDCGASIERGKCEEVAFKGVTAPVLVCEMKPKSTP